MSPSERDSEAGSRPRAGLLSLSPLILAAPLLVAMLVVALVSGHNATLVNVIAWVGGGLILMLSFARIVGRVRNAREQRRGSD